MNINFAYVLPICLFDFAYLNISPTLIFIKNVGLMEIWK